MVVWLRELKNGKPTGNMSGYGTLEQAEAVRDARREAIVSNPAWNHGAWVGYDWEVVDPNLVPALGYDGWTEDYTFHRMMTCRNHPTLRLSTKNMFERSIFRVVDDPDCNCPRDDWRVIVDQSQDTDRGWRATTLERTFKEMG